MKKIFIALSVALITLSGCATKALDKDVGGHCVSTNAAIGDVIQGMRVQWLSRGSGACTGNTPVNAKMVLQSEFMHPEIFKKMVEHHDGSILKAMAAGHTGLSGVSKSEQQKIIVRDCLLGSNNRALSCLPKSDFETAKDECARIGFFPNTLPHQQCTMNTLQAIRQNNLIKEAAENQAAEIRRMNSQREHNAMMNRLQQQTQPQQPQYQGYKNYECQARIGGRVECTGY
jgi:hypothetical protein